MEKTLGEICGTGIPLSHPVPLALSFKNVSKTYPIASGEFRTALQHVTFDLTAGQTVAVIGRSGSGKSTLLHLAAGIDIPSEGEVWLGDKNLALLSDRERTLLRRTGVGLVFQFFHLLPHLSVYDNIALPDRIRGEKENLTETRIKALLERVGLANRAGDSVQKLSGGEMQRVALCRALLPQPRLLLADEPTGNLDDATSRQIMDLLFEMTHEAHATLLYVTHSDELASRADQRWRIHSGELERLHA
jgi:putative ABC transport system ATP-binding protein